MKSGLDGRIIPLKLLRLLEHLRSWNPQQKQIFHKFEPKKWFTKRAAISVCFSQAVPGTFLDALASGIQTIWKKTLVIGGLVGEVSSSIQWCDQEDHHNLRNLGKASFWRRLSTRRWAVSKVPTWGVIIARSVTFIVTTITTIITISHYCSPHGQDYLPGEHIKVEFLGRPNTDVSSVDLPSLLLPLLRGWLPISDNNCGDDGNQWQLENRKRCLVTLWWKPFHPEDEVKVLLGILSLEKKTNSTVNAMMMRKRWLGEDYL